MKKKRDEQEESGLHFQINPEFRKNPEKFIKEMQEEMQKTYDELQKKFRSRPPFRRPWWPIRSAT